MSAGQAPASADSTPAAAANVSMIAIAPRSNDSRATPVLVYECASPARSSCTEVSDDEGEHPLPRPADVDEGGHDHFVHV